MSITTLCVAITIFFCVVTLSILVYNSYWYTGNHWFLFGTWVDRVLLKYKFWCAIVLSVPLLIPLLLKVSKWNIIVALCSIISFGFLYTSFNTLTD